MADLLLVVDMQNGFVNGGCRPIIPKVKSLVALFSGLGKPVAFTRFRNNAGSPYVRLIGWSKMMEEPQTGIIEELQEDALVVFGKNYYTPFTQAFKAFAEEKKATRMFICGIATDSCVLKAALDSFELGYEPVVVRDAVYSHAGEQAHEAGLFIISRNIGRGQLKSTAEVHQLLSHH